MGKYVELALSMREQKMREDENAMSSIKDRFLTDVAERVGKQGYASFEFRSPDKPDWWNYGYSVLVLARWAKEEGFSVTAKWLGSDMCGQPDILIIKLAYVS